MADEEEILHNFVSFFSSLSLLEAIHSVNDRIETAKENKKQVGRSVDIDDQMSLEERSVDN